MTGLATVIFLPSGRRGPVAIGLTIAEAARQLGADLDSVCGSRGMCGRCQVAAEGALSPLSEHERRCLADGRMAAGRRLGCVARIEGDVVVDVPPESQVHRPVVRKAADHRAIDADPVLVVRFLEVAPATLADQASDVERVERALAAQWGLAGPLRWPAGVLALLPRALRDGDGRVTLALRDGGGAAAVWPGLRTRAVGLAADIGTTTLAAHLCDLATGAVLASAGAMNPQIAFGEDVMSRVAHVQSQPASRAEMTRAVRQALCRLALAVAAEAQMDAADILEVALVGNPVMHHLLLGLDPVQLGAAPFPLIVDRALDLAAADLELTPMPLARVHVLPCIAGHVGADTAGMLLAEAPGDESTETVLMVDVGTNAEIVLARGPALWACSSPTGPAFEGAQISAGQRAAPGAIERVRIDPATLAPRVKVVGEPLWSDEAGFAADITGICGSGIIEAVAELFLSGVVTPDGRLDGGQAGRCPQLVRQGNAWAYRLVDGPRPILVTQTDIRAIQLAKAALYGGARLLMERAGVDQIDRVVLAGAFGSVIDPRHAMVLGMIPDCALERVSSVGNAAGTGARIALVSAKGRRWIQELVRRVVKVETAAAPGFQKLFVAAMALPHATDAFPHVGLAPAPPRYISKR